MLEEWIRWEPIKGMSRKYYVVSLLDSARVLEVLLSDTEEECKRIKITFGQSVHAYRSTDEGFRLEIIESLRRFYGNDFLPEWTFFQVLHSDYLKWISSQSYGISEKQGLIHFAFLAADSVVDVIAAYEPLVELFSQPI